MQAPFTRMKEHVQTVAGKLRAIFEEHGLPNSVPLVELVALGKYGPAPQIIGRVGTYYLHDLNDALSGFCTVTYDRDAKSFCAEASKGE